MAAATTASQTLAQQQLGGCNILLFSPLYVLSCCCPVDKRTEGLEPMNRRPPSAHLTCVSNETLAAQDDGTDHQCELQSNLYAPAKPQNDPTRATSSAEQPLSPLGTAAAHPCMVAPHQKLGCPSMRGQRAVALLGLLLAFSSSSSSGWASAESVGYGELEVCGGLLCWPGLCVLAWHVALLARRAALQLQRKHAPRAVRALTYHPSLVRGVAWRFVC